MSEAIFVCFDNDDILAAISGVRDGDSDWENDDNYEPFPLH